MRRSDPLPIASALHDCWCCWCCPPLRRLGFKIMNVPASFASAPPIRCCCRSNGRVASEARFSTMRAPGRRMFLLQWLLLHDHWRVLSRLWFARLPPFRSVAACNVLLLLLLPIASVAVQAGEPTAAWSMHPASPSRLVSFVHLVCSLPLLPPQVWDVLEQWYGRWVASVGAYGMLYELLPEPFFRINLTGDTC